MKSPVKKTKPSINLQAIAHNVQQTLPSSRQGFLQIIDHMGSFSSGFATAASRATSALENITAEGVMGIVPLRDDLRKIYRDVTASFTATASLVDELQSFVTLLDGIANWGLLLEQEAFLPSIANQIGSNSGDNIEMHTVGAIVDNLMEQIRPIIHEAISSCQQANDGINHLSRRIRKDLDASRHGLKTIRDNSDGALKRITAIIQNIETTCRMMEGHQENSHAVVSELVQALQYDDITAQRIEHVVTAINKADERLHNQERPEGVRWAVIALKMSIDQIDETAADLVSAIQTIHDQMTRLSDLSVEQVKAIGRVRSEGIRFRQENSEVTYHLGSLQSLGIFSDALSAEVMRTLSQVENALYQIKRAFLALGHAAGRLSKMADAMNARRNSSLEVLTSSIGDLTNRILQEGPKKITELTTAVAKIQGINQLYTEKIIPRLLRTTSQMRRIPLMTQQLEDNTLALISGLSETMGIAQATTIQIMLLAADMSFHTQLKESLDEVVDSLQEQITTLSQELPTPLEGNLASLAKEFDDLSSLYTMEKERRIHSAVLEGADGQEAVPEESGFELF